MSERGDRSLLAVGGVALAVLSLVGASGILILYLLAPAPILLVLELLFALLAPVGSALGAAVAARGPGPNRRWGWLAVGLASAVWLGVVPAAVALGLPRFRAFQLESRQRQAAHNLSRLQVNARSVFRDRGAFPAGDSGWVPGGPPATDRFDVDPATWDRPPWRELEFTPAAAHFHQYRYRRLADGSGFVLSARADLDEDGRVATTTSTTRVDGRGRMSTTGPDRRPDDTY